MQTNINGVRLKALLIIISKLFVGKQKSVRLFVKSSETCKTSEMMTKFNSTNANCGVNTKGTFFSPAHLFQRPNTQFDLQLVFSAGVYIGTTIAKWVSFFALRCNNGAAKFYFFCAMKRNKYFILIIFGSFDAFD